MSAPARPDPGRPSGRRALDHVVLPFETLVAARDVFDALGFKVAPDAIHPFGTGNACVFLADGIYLEPLARIDADAYASSLTGNQLFVANDARFRERHASPAMSAMAFGSGDAEADLAELRGRGLGDEGLVEFRRTFEAPGGERQEMAFRLAFALPSPVVDATAFYCQPLHDVAPDRSALTVHRNGATGLLRLVYAGQDTLAIAEWLAEVGRSCSERDGYGGDRHIVALDNCSIEVATLPILAERYGTAASDCAKGAAGPGRLRGMVLATADLSVTRRVLEDADAAVGTVDGRIVVPLGTGDCFIAFEEVLP